MEHRELRETEFGNANGLGFPSYLRSQMGNTKRDFRGSVSGQHVRATGSPSGRKGVPGEIFISPVSQRGNGIILG